MRLKAGKYYKLGSDVEKILSTGDNTFEYQGYFLNYASEGRLPCVYDREGVEMTLDEVVEFTKSNECSQGFLDEVQKDLKNRSRVSRVLNYLFGA